MPPVSANDALAPSRAGAGAAAHRAIAWPAGAATADPLLRPHHVARLEAVVEHIDAHLGEDLALDALAARAAISPFHFHRLFKAWSGETLKAFVRRRRLEAAASRLRYGHDEKVTALALACGFAAPEAFARAFRDHFGMSPSEWRAGGWALWRAPANEPLSVGGFAIRVRRDPAIDLLALRGRGDFGAVAPGLWSRLLPLVDSLGLGGQPLLFLGLDDPAIAAPERCRMDACVQLPEGPPLTDWPLARRSLPARWVASLEFEGPPEAIAHGWQVLLTRWLPASPFRLVDGHFFERYDPAQGHPCAPRVRCELCMPVAPRQG